MSYNVKILDSIIFFDIETAPEERNLDELKLNNPALEKAFLWSCNFRKNVETQSCEDYYQETAPLTPEYGKIVCFSYGKIKWAEDYSSYKIKTYSYCSFDEKVILEKVSSLMDMVEENKFNLAGHNIKDFDIPFLIKRFLINGIPVPNVLWRVVDKKPWETGFMDTKEIWKFGSYSQKNTLMEIAVCLGLKSPKEVMQGKDVRIIFYEDKDLEKISTYCEGDVRTTAEILIKLSNYKGE